MTSSQTSKMRAPDLERQAEDLRKTVWRELTTLRNSVSGEFATQSKGKKDSPDGKLTWTTRPKTLKK